MSGDEINLPKNDISTTIKFSVISEILEKIVGEKVAAKKNERFKNYMESFKLHSTQFKIENGDESIYSVFPVLRLLMPSKDSLRGSYGIKTNKMGKLLVKALGIDPKGGDASKLMSPSEADYSMAVYNVAKNRCRPTSTITVYEINRRLDNIAEFYNNNSAKKIDEELYLLIQNMTAMDLKWITRIILKKIYLGLGPEKMFATYHPKAKNIYAQCSSLKTTCEMIDSGKDVNEVQKLEPFSAIRPMLCERRNISELERILSANEYTAETKMDGERFQLHMVDGEFRYFSRNGFDYTKTFGLNAKSGSLTPLLHKLIKNLVRNVILDGEMMVWNKTNKNFHTKGEGLDVKAMFGREKNLGPCFVVYDVLYLNDEPMIGKPHVERRRLLETLITEHEGVLVKCKPTKVKDCQHLLEYLNRAIDTKEEGIVIKQVDSLYRPDVRNNGGWYKIKPDYIDGLVADFDLMILGGFYNSRKTYIESYLLGVLEYRNKHNTCSFHSVGIVNLGLSHAKRIELSDKLKPHWQDVEMVRDGRKMVGEQPDCMVWGSQYPDVWIDPKLSVILKIEATELFKSTAFGTEYTLRFPRIVEIRYDKLWRDTCSFEEYNRLSQDNQSKVAKITKRHITALDLNDVMPPAKRTRSSKRLQRTVVQPIVDTINLPSCVVDRIDNMCSDKSFCLLSNKPETVLKELILKRGGKIVAHPSANFDDNLICVAVNGMTTRVKHLSETKKYNIVTLAWLRNALSFERKRLLDFEPSDLLAIASETKAELALKFDQFGDSYTKECDVTKIKQIIDGIDVNVLPKLLRSELYSMEIDVCKIEDDAEPYHFMRPICGYFIKSGSGCEVAEIIFKTRGGHVSETINNAVTYIFVDPKNKNRSEIEEKIGSSKIKPISIEWIRECHKSGKRVSKRSYRISTIDIAEG